ncbi:uncharacterized protein LOC127849343 [Dreissena polymorpha]|nr:uncharacterized protein LOC127849343 [Dreissena polymorpha]XP_052238033.1 uncharacterized protein LOC127849343 [Dreissena polymorpha]XP_052238034.1 uncharacterized protein LOC127849343 [Dreissena polymorpha]XP_052238035.1 uncharacterized protein LOC127849343 [Dreissena polymorpha]
MIELFLVGGLLVFALYAWSMNTRRSDGRKVPPGPDQSLVFGNFKDIDTERVHQSLHALSKKYGTIMSIRLLRRKIVVLNSADVINEAFGSEQYKDLLNDKAQGFYGTYLVYGHADVLLGPCRDLTFRIKEVMSLGLRPAMVPSALAGDCRKLLEMLGKHGSNDFDPADDLQTLFAEVTSKLISGEVKDGDVKLMWDFVDWSNRLLNPSVESLLKNFPFLRHLPVKVGVLFREVLAKRDVLLARYLDTTRETYVKGKVRGLVDTCFAIQENEIRANGESWLTDDMVRATILDTIGAGLVSTTNSVLAVILNLLHNPACQDRMRQELRAVVHPAALVTQADMNGLPYCRAVVMETLRLSCVVPIVSHYCSAGDVDLAGYTIEKGTMVWGNLWSALHDDHIWVEPWSFKPERFLDDDGKLLPKEHKFMKALIPLGVGRRICVGYDFAMTRIFAFVTTMVQHYDITPPVDTELLSNDPNLFSAGAVLQPDRFKCKLVKIQK